VYGQPVPHPNDELIVRFYDAFARLDGQAMAGCYAPDVHFEDPGLMWRTLTGRATDLAFSTGRRVHNDVRATFRFDAGGRIAVHRDDFDLYGWTRQALGPAGLLLGWTPLLQGKVRRQARAQLDDFSRAASRDRSARSG